MSGRNLRLLGLEKSPAEQPTIEETITALEAELQRGEAVYTTDELARLARKLEEYRFMLQRMISA